MEKLYDITEVCRMFGISSRTLRYYEERGLICSTAEPFSGRRRYSEEQLKTIREVRILRSLGLPLARIAELRDSRVGLGECIAEHRARLLALIEEKAAELNLLEEALARISGGGDLFAPEPVGTMAEDTSLAVACSDRQLEIARECTDAILEGDFSRLFRDSSEEIRHLSNESELRYGWEQMERSVGAFVGKGEPERDARTENFIYQLLHYEKMDVRVKYVFHGEIVCGFWYTYRRKEG